MGYILEAFLAPLEQGQRHQQALMTKHLGQNAVALYITHAFGPLAQNLDNLNRALEFTIGISEDLLLGGLQEKVSQAGTDHRSSHTPLASHVLHFGAGLDQLLIRRYCRWLLPSRHRHPGRWPKSRCND